MSTTAVLEKIRDQINAATPAPADFLLGPGGLQDKQGPSLAYVATLLIKANAPRRP